MTISHQPDHFKENGEQAMRWHARLTLGTNITVGKNCFHICDDYKSCEGARKQTFNWAKQFMESQFDEWVETRDDIDEWT